jgi:hypothetical protein
MHGRPHPVVEGAQQHGAPAAARQPERAEPLGIHLVESGEHVEGGDVLGHHGARERRAEHARRLRE